MAVLAGLGGAYAALWLLCESRAARELRRDARLAGMFLRLSALRQAVGSAALLAACEAVRGLELPV